MPHVPWPSIENFAHARRSLAERGTIRVFSKVKLHGTNGAVRIDPDGTVTTQSRNQDVAPDAGGTGHFGMASWVAANADAFRTLAREDGPVVLYGEWAGPGVNNGDAVSRIPERTFFVFSVRTDYGTHLSQWTGERVVEHLQRHGLNGRIRALPPEHYREVNFADPLDTERFLADVDALVAQVGERDPYVFETFGIEGPGEGVVVYAAGDDERPLFKAKVDGHGTAKGPRPAKQPRDVAKVANAQDFARVAVSEERLAQALRETGATGRKDTGTFVKWVNADVAKECAQELDLAGLTWPDVAGPVQKRASAWYLAQVSCAV